MLTWGVSVKMEKGGGIWGEGRKTGILPVLISFLIPLEHVFYITTTYIYIYNI